MKEYYASNFHGHCLVDEDFIPWLDKINQAALENNVFVHVISSYRKDAIVPGAIRKPAKHSNHMVGHAIDVNITDKHGFWYNSKRMQQAFNVKHDPVYSFLKRCIELGVRWGGYSGAGDTFCDDPVHFDDAINVVNPKLWVQKFNLIHKTFLTVENLAALNPYDKVKK